MRVRFLRKWVIENNANALLKQFIHEAGKIECPVPVEEVVMFLGLSLDYDNLSQRFGIEGEVLGCLNVETKEIFIEENLLPEVNPLAREGRYRFTVGHETGHWVLHRDLVNDPGQATLFETQQSTIVCQSSSNKPWIEWQADYFSTCLLMPRTWIYQTIDRQNLRSLPPEKIVYHISELFEVSKQAAGIRLEELGMIENSGRVAIAS